MANEVINLKGARWNIFTEYNDSRTGWDQAVIKFLVKEYMIDVFPFILINSQVGI